MWNRWCSSSLSQSISFRRIYISISHLGGDHLSIGLQPRPNLWLSSSVRSMCMCKVRVSIHATSGNIAVAQIRWSWDGLDRIALPKNYECVVLEQPAQLLTLSLVHDHLNSWEVSKSIIAVSLAAPPVLILPVSKTTGSRLSPCISCLRPNRSSTITVKLIIDGTETYICKQ